MGNKNSRSSSSANSSTSSPPTSNDASSSSSTPSGKSARLSKVASKKVTLEDFALLTTVGKGSFGRVIQVREKKTGKIYAMKVLRKNHVIRRKQYEHTMTERRILEEIDHPFIVSLHFAFQSSTKLYLVVNYFNGGELFNYLSSGGRFAPERAQFYGAEIALALDYLHSVGIIYRDLKPENLILDASGHIRITDFGLSKTGVEDSSQNIKSFCGTPEYLAPEILKRKAYGKVCDWWSYGTLLYEMLAGLPPYYDRDRNQMYKKILGDELKFPSHFSNEAKDILTALLQRNPLERLGYNGGSEVKNHPYYANIDFDLLYEKKLEPPFKPEVADDNDTSTISKDFTKIPAAVSMTPAGAQPLRDVDADFSGFTFQENVIDGHAYSVSMSEEDFDNLSM